VEGIADFVLWIADCIIQSAFGRPQSEIDGKRRIRVIFQNAWSLLH
jgi:hypothetical protein